MKKIVSLCALLLLMGTAKAQWSQIAVPSRIDLIGGGFVVMGNFGNPANCASGFLYVPSSHPNYKQVYATVLTAYIAKRKIQAYIHTCEMVGWYGYTHSTLHPGSAINVMD